MTVKDKSLTMPARIAAGLLSIGWLVPFVLAGSAAMDFLSQRRIAAFMGLRPPPAPAGLVFQVDLLSVVGAVWLATVLTGWVAYFTRRTV
jgi:hypothetical protein